MRNKEKVKEQRAGAKANMIPWNQLQALRVIRRLSNTLAQMLFQGTGPIWKYLHKAKTQKRSPYP